MTMPKEEAEALRRCLSILAPLHPAHERRTMALQIEKRIAGQESALLALSFKQLGPLFYPTDKHMAQEVAQKMLDAFNVGGLASSLKSYANGVLISDLIAWPDCPPVPADSPMAYWLPKVMQVPANTGTDAVVVATDASLASPLIMTPARKNEANYKRCVELGLDMPTELNSSGSANMPRGISQAAKDMGMSRPSLTESVIKHLENLNKKRR